MTDPIPPPSPTPTWRAGTLTYTLSGLAVLFVWLLLGDFSFSMRDRSVGPLAQWYLAQLNVPELLFGLLTSSFPVLLGLILGPIISVKSDRHRGKWGRRIPFLLVTTPMAVFGMLGLAATPFITTWVHGCFPTESKMVISVICFGIFWAAFETATIISGGIFGGLINDVVPRPLLGRFFGLFRAVSLIDGMIFNFWLIGKAPDHFALILTCIALFYGTAFMWICLKVKEGDYPPPPPRETPRHGWVEGFSNGMKMYFRESFSKPYYLSVFCMMMVAGLAFGPINIFAIPYARSLGLDMTVYGHALALTYLISLCLSYFLGWLADWLHPLRVALITLLGYVIVTAWGSVYATTPKTFLIAWVLHGVLSGCYFTGAASLAQRLFPHEKFAQFTSAAGVVAAPFLIGLAPLVGLLIDRTGHIYRYTFISACGLTILALASTWLVYRQFMRLGGPKSYVAPE